MLAFKRFKTTPTILSVEIVDEPQITRIGYPKRLGISNIVFTSKVEHVTLEKPRRFRKPRRYKKSDYELLMQVNFKDGTNVRYRRKYTAENIEEAIKKGERDIVFMVDIYLQITQQRYGNK